MHSLPNESVFFYTFHKCASTLFSTYVLKNFRGLTHIDYASLIYSGEALEEVIFQETGYIYGPIRLSVDVLSPVYARLVAPVSQPDFIKNKVAIFFIRDPRDILISFYYSFGYTHGFSPVPEISEQEINLRHHIQALTLDDYALSAVDGIVQNFNKLDSLSKACERSIILRYEDLVDDFENFIRTLTTIVSLDQHVVTEIYQRSRPALKEDNSSHRRSGKVGGFRDKLKKETIDLLNKRLEPTLAAFRYDA